MTEYVVGLLVGAVAGSAITLVVLLTVSDRQQDQVMDAWARKMRPLATESPAPKLYKGPPLWKLWDWYLWNYGDIWRIWSKYSATEQDGSSPRLLRSL